MNNDGAPIYDCDLGHSAGVYPVGNMHSCNRCESEPREGKDGDDDGTNVVA
jgi:hypothetical protein